MRDYVIEKMIGRGGMGSVYLATHIHLETHAAIKVLLEQFSDNSSVKNRFINEARLLHKLKHQNIVEQREFFEENGRLVLVMEYVDGRPLDKMIGQDVGPIPWKKTVPLFTQVLDGIGYAHSIGVVHRDIKPANILISKEGQVKVTDLGIAKIAGEQGMTRTGTQMGTLYYESPEQIRGAKDVDHRSDIYSLGMTLYEMLAGRLPFHNEEKTSEFEIMNAVVHRQNSLDPREHYPHIPEWLVKTVQKATSLDPEKRFQSCAEFKNTLSKHVDFSETYKDYWSGRAIVVKSPNTMQLALSPCEVSTTSRDHFLCPNCNALAEQGTDFCMKCGTSLLRKCQHCRALIRWYAEFCPKCGIAVVEQGQFAWSETENSSIMDVNQLRKMKDQDRLKLLMSLMCFVDIPSGSFMMGTPPVFMSHGGAERPYHRVEMNSFHILSTPVTQLVWKIIMFTNPSSFPSDLKPVESVSWDDCQEFICRLNKLDTEKNYALLTEAEWEYACRAGSRSRNHWGGCNLEKTTTKYCWSSSNSNSSTHPVGQKKSNDWGLFDMLGNVFEWCQDVYCCDYNATPTDGSSYSGEGTTHVCRGGSWYHSIAHCRSSNRGNKSHHEQRDYLGFRIKML